MIELKTHEKYSIMRDTSSKNFCKPSRIGLIDVATSKQQLAEQVKTMRARIPKLDKQARQAVAADREDLARMALNRKQTALAELEGLDMQLAELDQEEAQLAAAEQADRQPRGVLQDHKEATKARYSAAEAQVQNWRNASPVSPANWVN